METADRSALRSEGSSALELHLRACAGCRARAMRVEAGTERLAEMVLAGGPIVVAGGARRIASPRGRRAAALALLPLAAAAAVVALVRREPPPPAPVERVQNDHSVATSVAVEVQRGQTATVIRTANPNVTIVWLTPGGTE